MVAEEVLVLRMILLFRFNDFSLWPNGSAGV
jgi:hypothetical protein